MLLRFGLALFHGSLRRTHSVVDAASLYSVANALTSASICRHKVQIGERFADLPQASIRVKANSDRRDGLVTTIEVVSTKEHFLGVLHQRNHTEGGVVQEVLMEKEGAVQVAQTIASAFV